MAAACSQISQLTPSLLGTLVLTRNEKSTPNVEQRIPAEDLQVHSHSWSFCHFLSQLQPFLSVLWCVHKK
jgi:hypothetical protein